MSIPFKSAPPFYAKNNKSSVDNTLLVEDAIHLLLSKNCISEVKDIPFSCNPLPVAIIKNTKLCLVLELRHVNQYVRLDKFKYGNWKTFADLFDKDNYFMTFNLTSGYHFLDAS